VTPEQLKYNLPQEDGVAQVEVIPVFQFLRNKSSQKTRITSSQTHDDIPSNIIKLLSMGELPKPKKNFFKNFGLTKSFFWFPPDKNNNNPKTIHIVTSYNTLHE
jgi:hypothetical protein